LPLAILKSRAAMARRERQFKHAGRVEFSFHSHARKLEPLPSEKSNGAKLNLSAENSPYATQVFAYQGKTNIDFFCVVHIIVLFYENTAFEEHFNKLPGGYFVFLIGSLPAWLWTGN